MKYDTNFYKFYKITILQRKLVLIECKLSDKNIQFFLYNRENKTKQPLKMKSVYGDLAESLQLAPDVLVVGQLKQILKPQQQLVTTTTTTASDSTTKNNTTITIEKQLQSTIMPSQSTSYKIRRLSKLNINGHSQSSSDQQQQWNKQKSQQINQPSMEMINVLNMIKQSQPLDKKVLKPDSLAYDIKLGWIPKTQVTGPIPLSFSHRFIDSVIQSKLDQSKLLYLGPRHSSSFQIHQNYYKQGKSYPFYQFHLCKSQFLERFFKKYYPDYKFDANHKRGKLIESVKLAADVKGERDQLIFQSDYQGGNLDAVYFEDEEYRLMIRVDSNTRGHCNYYNFKVKCVHQGTYRFRIMNMSKRKLLYQRGMKPYIKVLNKKAAQQTPWSQCGTTQCQNVRFCPSPLNDIPTEEYKQFYSLKFQLQLNPSYEYQLCYCIPYTYSQLCHFINSMRDSKNLHVSKLGYSLSGVEVPLLTIADNNNRQNVKVNSQEEEESNLFYVVITGRIHPAESNSSHIVNGLIKFLLKALPQTENVQKHIVFKIIPMLNPDGVIIGNTRTGFAGKDLNRKFSIKTEFIFPEVNNLRDYVTKMKQKYGKKLLFVIDIHGHSTRKGSFFFGPQYSVLDEQYTKCRLLPKLFSLRSEVFRYYSCKFKISQGKEATSRGFFNTNGVRTYTHETSVHSFYDFSTRKDLTFTKKTLQLLGQNLALAIFDYVQKVHLFTTVKQIIEINPNKPYSPKKQHHPTIPLQPLPQDSQHESDKMPSDKADSQSQADDFENKKLTVFYQRINENRQYFYDQIVKMLKNKKQTLASNNSMKKDKKMKLNQIQKDKQRKQKEVKREIFQKRKSNVNQTGNKVNYMPKKTLFEEYSKQPLNIQKSATQKNPIKISSKLKIGKNQYPYHLRSNSQKIQQDFLFGFQRVKLQSNTNRIIYSVPSMKWDYDSQHGTSRFDERNQIYRYDFNDYPKTELRQKKQKIMHGKYMQNVFAEPQRKQLKINRQLLEKLLVPSSNMVVNEHVRNEVVKVATVKEVKSKYKASNVGQHFANTDFKVFAAFSEINKSEELNAVQERGDKVRFQSQVGPQVETKKQEYLCKKWEKEILFRTKRAHSFGGRVQMGQTQFGTYQSSFVKTFSKQFSKSPKLTEVQKLASPQTELPKIFLNKKDVLIIN